MRIINVADILFDIHKNIIPSLLPLTSIHSQEDKFEHIQEGYNIGYTTEEFQNEYPSIDINNMFYSKAALNGMAYYDAEKYIFFDTRIYGTDALVLGDESADSAISKMVKICEKAYQEKDYLQLCLHQNGGEMMYLMRQIILHEPLTPELYKLFYNLYTYADYGFHEIGRDAIKKVLASKSTQQKAATARRTKDLPDVLTIYRGEADKSLPYTQAYSWTLDENVANFFAVRLGSKNFKVYRAKVRKDNIIEYFNNGTEEEVLCLPNAIFSVERINLPSLTQILKRTQVLQEFRDQYDRLKPMAEHYYADEEHGFKHVQRVMFLSVIIAERQGLKHEQFTTLMEAAAYHDAGRENELKDTTHGKTGYEKYLMNHKPDDIIKFLITYHCIDDKVAKESLNGLPARKAAEAWTLYCCLKDADALDRVRFGIRDLDITFLRFDYSRRLVAVAEQLLHAKFE